MISHTNKEIYLTLLEGGVKLPNDEEIGVNKVYNVLNELSEDLTFYLLSKGVPESRLGAVIGYCFSKSYSSKRLNKDVFEVEKRRFKLNKSCSLCGSKEALTVHHVKKTGYFPELKYDPNNWIVLCDECHNKLHHKDNIKELNLND